jgi:hypothetical protein
MTIALHDTPTDVMFAAFWNKGWSRFIGIEMDAADADCFAGLRRKTDMRGLDLALNVTFGPDWRSLPLYQTIASLEAAPVDTRHVFMLPQQIATRRRYERGPLDAPGARVVLQSSIASGSTSQGWTFRGVSEEIYGYLLQYEPTAADARRVLVVEGTLRRGGIGVGLLRDAKWTQVGRNSAHPSQLYVNVFDRGRFRVLIQPEEPGLYQVAIAGTANGKEPFYESRRSSLAFLRRLGLMPPPTDASIDRIGWSTVP